MSLASALENGFYLNDTTTNVASDPGDPPFGRPHREPLADMFWEFVKEDLEEGRFCTPIALRVAFMVVFQVLAPHEQQAPKMDWDASVLEHGGIDFVIEDQERQRRVVIYVEPKGHVVIKRVTRDGVLETTYDVTSVAPALEWLDAAI